MGKYQPLTAFLAGASADEVPMTFSEIECVLGTSLPASKQYPAWWSNNPSNNVMTRAWLAAGFRTERVDTASERLVFRREVSKRAASAPQTEGGGTFLDRVRTLLGGSVTVRPGTDLTAPTGEVWDAERG